MGSVGTKIAEQRLLASIQGKSGQGTSQGKFRQDGESAGKKHCMKGREKKTNQFMGSVGMDKAEQWHLTSIQEKSGQGTGQRNLRQDGELASKNSI